MYLSHQWCSTPVNTNYNMQKIFLPLGLEFMLGFGFGLELVYTKILQGIFFVRT